MHLVRGLMWLICVHRVTLFLPQLWTPYLPQIVLSKIVGLMRLAPMWHGNQVGLATGPACVQVEHAIYLI